MQRVVMRTRTLAVTLVASLCAAFPPAAAARSGESVAEISCTQTQVEPPVRAFNPRRDLISGPAALVGWRELARRTVKRSFEPKDGKLGGAKLPLAARAGHTVRLRVAPDQVGRVFLDFTGQAGLEVRAVPCPRRQARITAWPGAVSVTGPVCARLLIYDNGKRRADLRLPLGRTCAR